MADMPTPEARNEAWWQEFLTKGHPALRATHGLFKHLPGTPRCKRCAAPYGGVLGSILGLAGFRPSRKNPRLCAW